MPKSSLPPQAKRTYQKPQAVDLSVSATAGGTTGPLELMMMTAPGRKTSTAS